MFSLLSLAWLKARIGAALTGVTAQAVAIALVVLAAVGGLWWLRHDARMDERHAWQLKMADARVAHQHVLLARERKSAAIAAAASQAWAQELAAAQAATTELQAKLESRTRTVCYPKDIVKALNR